MDHQALADLPLFAGMSDDELRESASAFETVRVLMGDRLTSEHEYGYSFFVVLDGRVQVEIGGEVVAELTRGDHFGEVALVHGTRRNATVKATEGSHLAKIMTWDFKKLMAEHPALATRIKAAADERAR